MCSKVASSIAIDCCNKQPRIKSFHLFFSFQTSKMRLRSTHLFLRDRQCFKCLVSNPLSSMQQILCAGSFPLFILIQTDSIFTGTRLCSSQWPRHCPRIFWGYLLNRVNNMACRERLFVQLETWYLHRTTLNCIPHVVWLFVVATAVQNQMLDQKCVLWWPSVILLWLDLNEKHSSR